VIKKLIIKNYRSIYNASVSFENFSLLIGSNGSGKTNLLKLLRDLSQRFTISPSTDFPTHYNHQTEVQLIELTTGNNIGYEITIHKSAGKIIYKHRPGPAAVPKELNNVRIFCVDPSIVGRAENLSPNPIVQENGTGTVQVLDSLKTGDREELFNNIEKLLCEYIPEIEKLSFVPGPQSKKLQIRERHILRPVPVEAVSEGTRLLIVLLTIMHQENPPSIICIEDIDKGMHPRLFQKVIEFCKDVAGKNGKPQIIATTHNPYLVDQFKGQESSVIITEKIDGNTCFSLLSERLSGASSDEDPLGELWFSGAMGGTPSTSG